MACEASAIKSAAAAADDNSDIPKRNSIYFARFQRDKATQKVNPSGKQQD